MFEDLRFAARRLRRAPGFTVAALLTLTLAIGVNVSVLSVADAVLFRPLPYDDPDSVFILTMVDRRSGQRYTRMSGELLQAIDEHHGTLSSVAIVNSRPGLVVPGSSGAEMVRVSSVTDNYFRLLGARPAHGRVLDQTDRSSTGRPAMLTHEAWQSRFGGDQSIVGRSISVGTTAFDIVGVLPSDFVFPSAYAGRPEVITLLDQTALKGGAFNPIVRVDAGSTIARAQAEMDALVMPLIRREDGQGEISVAFNPVRSVIYPAPRSIMLFLVASAGLILLIGCANLANMLLARNARFERENGVRVTLGAGMARLVRPVLFESLMIGLAGAGLALLAGWMTFDWLLPHIPAIAYGTAPVGLDLRVALITVAIGLAAGFCFSAAPAWRAARVDPQVLLQARDRGNRGTRGWFRYPLIALQVAASVALVFGAVVAARAFVALLNVPLGFDPAGVVRIIGQPNLREDALQAFYVRVLETLGRRADVVAVGAAGSMPLDLSAPDDGMAMPDGTRAPAGLVHVLPGYFEATGIPLLRGRLLTLDDVRSGGEAAVLSQSAAAAVFPGRDPLGLTFSNGRGRRFMIVGVVGDVLKSHDDGSGRRDLAPAYVIPGSSIRRLTIVVRMRPGLSGDSVLADLKREVALLAPEAPLNVTWWSTWISRLSDYRNPRFQAIVLAGFGLLALALTAFGVFAVISFLVASRTREIGIRVAIGAEPQAVVRYMARHALAPVVLGIVIGTVATRWMARLAEAQLFRVNTSDPATLVIAAVAVLVTGAIAAYLPARRATRVDPIVALRAE